MLDGLRDFIEEQKGTEELPIIDILIEGEARGSNVNFGEKWELVRGKTNEPVRIERQLEKALDFENIDVVKKVSGITIVA